MGRMKKTEQKKKNDEIRAKNTRTKESEQKRKSQVDRVEREHQKSQNKNRSKGIYSISNKYIFLFAKTYRKLDPYAKQSDFLIKRRKRVVFDEKHRSIITIDRMLPNKSEDTITNKANYDAFCADSMDSELIY